VRWHLRYGLSYRDVEELLAERAVQVDHVTIYRWVRRFTPILAEAARVGVQPFGLWDGATEPLGYSFAVDVPNTGWGGSFYDDPVVFDSYTRHHDSGISSPNHVMEEPAAEIGYPTGLRVLDPKLW
jgi:hypothetical protein